MASTSFSSWHVLKEVSSSSAPFSEALPLRSPFDQLGFAGSHMGNTFACIQGWGQALLFHRSAYNPSILIVWAGWDRTLGAPRLWKIGRGQTTTRACAWWWTQSTARQRQPYLRLLSLRELLWPQRVSTFLPAPFCLDWLWSRPSHPLFFSFFCDGWTVSSGCQSISKVCSASPRSESLCSSLNYACWSLFCRFTISCDVSCRNSVWLTDRSLRIPLQTSAGIYGQHWARLRGPVGMSARSFWIQLQGSLVSTLRLGSCGEG